MSVTPQHPNADQRLYDLIYSDQLDNGFNFFHARYLPVVTTGTYSNTSTIHVPLLSEPLQQGRNIQRLCHNRTRALPHEDLLINEGGSDDQHRHGAPLPAQLCDQFHAVAVGQVEISNDKI